MISRLENEYEQHGNNLSPAKVLAKNSLQTDVVTEKNFKFSSTKSEEKSLFKSLKQLFTNLKERVDLIFALNKFIKIEFNFFNNLYINV